MDTRNSVHWLSGRHVPTAQPINQNLAPHQASLVARTVNNLPVVWETWVRSLGWEDPLEKERATHSSVLAWRIPMDRGTWQATVHGIAKSWTLSD